MHFQGSLGLLRTLQLKLKREAGTKPLARGEVMDGSGNAHALLVEGSRTFPLI